MIKTLRLGTSVIIFFDDNTSIIHTLESEGEYNAILNMKTKEEYYKKFYSSYAEQFEKQKQAKKAIENIQKSKLLTFTKNSVYWKEISPLSMPLDLINRILKAEKENNTKALTAYKNFWTLMSLNPNPECRRDLFQFLQIYGMTISKSGFFVGYRNVDKTDKEGVYTDHHSHTFKIKIGDMVVMDRKKCDSNNNITCSCGLHVAGKGWLKRNYFGNVGMAVLVNPADVVAVPQVEDNYGKLRTCAYLPMALINYDEQDDVIPLDVEDGFDCTYITKVIYEGIKGTEQDSLYKIEIPKIKGFDIKSIQDTLLDIAKDCIVNRTLN